MLNTLINDDSFTTKAGLGHGLKGKRIIVQGFGNVGFYFSHFCHKAGAKIVGIIERDSGIYSTEGFNPNDLKLHMNSGKSLSDFPGAEVKETLEPIKILKQDCDIFAPCANDGTLNANNADWLKAKVVIEGANGPTTFAADNILKSKGVQVIPDMLANVGGVTVSYFEWLKNLDHVSPGRMTKKNQEQQKKNLIKMLGYKFPENSPIMQSLQGAKEIDIVYSGLEEIMVTAT